MLQLDPGRTWFEDRRAEVLEFFRECRGEAEARQAAQAMESQAYNLRQRDPLFVGADDMTEAQIIESYRRASSHQILRLMLAYDRVDQALPLVNLALTHAPAGPMLDYGCGASDTGLVFDTFGFEVAICDVAGGNLDLAVWRYGRRNIQTQIIAAGPDNVYPDLGQNLSFIAALEILEHLPSPIAALEKMHAALATGGLFAAREKSFESTEDDAHLFSAYEEWRSGRYTQVRDRLFKDLTPTLGRRFRGGKYMKVYAKI